MSFHSQHPNKRRPYAPYEGEAAILTATFFRFWPLFLAEMAHFPRFLRIFLAFQHFLKGGGFSGREMEQKPPPLFLEPKIRIFDREGGGFLLEFQW